MNKMSFWGRIFLGHCGKKEKVMDNRREKLIKNVLDLSINSGKINANAENNVKIYMNYQN